MKKTYKITAFDLVEDQKKDKNNRMVTGLEDEITVKYVKGGAKPTVTLLYGGAELKEGKDYKLSYKNNTKVI